MMGGRTIPAWPTLRIYTYIHRQNPLILIISPHGVKTHCLVLYNIRINTVTTVVTQLP